tara:strand:- start:156 stop:551 length:396 start_codon:yes stop_codon:yes gene_type:complete
MRVRISYAVDSEEIPEEVSMLVDRSSVIADKVSADTSRLSQTCIDRNLSLDELDTVLAIREQLIKLDSYLGDVAQLILGHQQMKMQMAADKGDIKEVEQETPHEEEGPLEGLLEKTNEISQGIYEFDDDEL